MGSNLPPLTQAEQGENGVFDNDSPLPQNRGHAADHIRRFRELRQIDAGETARRPANDFRAISGPRKRSNFKHQTSNILRCLSPLIARWNICNAHTKKTGSLMPTSFQVPLGAENRMLPPGWLRP